MNKKIFAFMLLASLLPAATRADVVQMPAGNAPASATPAPRKGETMSEVEKQFGEPQVKHPAVGGGSEKQPPITRWDYSSFSVFFEHSHVVEAVVPGDRPEVKHEDQLQAAQ